MKTTTTICNANQRTAEIALPGNSQIVANDDDATPAAKFVPTLFELGLLARHWLNARMEIDRTYFLHGPSGLAEARLDRLAQERMKDIRQAMGEDNYSRFAVGVELQLAECNSRPIGQGNDQRLPAQPTLREFPDDCDRLEWDRHPHEKLRFRSVYEVNRHGGEIGADLLPSMLELELITRHWLFTHLDTSYYCHVVNQSGSRENRLIIYSDRRLEKLRRALGDERYLRVCVSSISNSKNGLARRKWRNFRIPEK